MPSIWISVKAFTWFPTTTFSLGELEGGGFDDKTVWWMRNWMYDHIQKVVDNGSMSGWRSVRNGVPQESILGQVQFNIFINDMGKAIECTLCRFAKDAKLSGAVDTTEGQTVMQRDLDKLNMEAKGNLMRFKTKCKVLYLGHGNPQNQYMLGDEALQRRTWGHWRLKSWTRANSVCLKPRKQTTSWAAQSNVASRLSEGVLGLHSAPVRPYQLCAS